MCPNEFLEKERNAVSSCDDRVTLLWLQVAAKGVRERCYQTGCDVRRQRAKCKSQYMGQIGPRHDEVATIRDNKQYSGVVDMVGKLAQKRHCRWIRPMHVFRKDQQW